MITGQAVVSQAGTNKSAIESGKDYNSFGLNFTITGTFDNLQKLLSDIEQNLRIIDISRISFDAGDKDIYKYDIKAKIYWLK